MKNFIRSKGFIAFINFALGAGVMAIIFCALSPTLKSELRTLEKKSAEQQIPIVYGPEGDTEYIVLQGSEPKIITSAIMESFENSTSDHDVVTVLRPYFASLAVITGQLINGADALSDAGQEINEKEYLEQLREVNESLNEIVQFQ